MSNILSFPRRQLVAPLPQKIIVRPREIETITRVVPVSVVMEELEVRTGKWSSIEERVETVQIVSPAD